MSIYKKIHEICKECPELVNDGYNEFVGYSYSSDKEVKSKIKPLLLNKGLTFIPNVTDSMILNHITTVTLRIVFIDITDDTFQEFYWKGSAYDQFGKGTQKAVTAGIKSFFKHLFMLEAGDDPDAETKKVKDDEKPEGKTPLEKLENKISKKKEN